MYNNLDKQPIITNVKRRKNKVYNFYYSTYGQIIKRRRLELNKTQEAVAESICSNTYISKAENNQVVIGEDQLNLIMEKLNISKQEFANPETLIYYLGRVIEYYYFKDIESYQKLIQRIEGYHFHALVQIMKLGFYILTKQYEDAIYIYHQLLDYLNSMDELAFSVYLTFSADLCIKNNQINLAKFLIDTVFQIHIDYHELRCLYSYIKYKIYGRIDMPIAAMGIYSSLIEMVADTGNQLLIKELVLHKAILSELYSEKNHISILGK